MSTYDTIFLGSSPNALVAACYLARAHQRVLVLESSPHIGGSSSTAEFAQGFHGDLGLTSGRLDATIVKELQLDRHGLDVIERDSMTSLLPDGRSFTVSADPHRAAEVIGSLSSKDVAAYSEFMNLLDLAADLLRHAYAMTPPHAHRTIGSDAQNLALLVGRLRGYGHREMTEVIRLLVMPVRDMLDEWFESVELKGLLASPAVRGLTQGPFASGTTFNLLHHLAIGDGYFRATARGGIGATSQALAQCARSFGVEIKTNVEIHKVLVTGGTATGVELSGNERVEGSKIVSDYDARYTFTNLVAPFELEPEFNRAVQHVRYNGAVARVNLALRELPHFEALKEDALLGTLMLAPSIAYLEKAFDATKRGDISEHPYIEVTIPSLLDAQLAPPGQHVLSLWLQYAPYSGHVKPERVLEVALERISQFAPNLRSLILHTQVLTPHDYEKRFHLSEGHLYGGDMTLAQAFFMRPLPGYAQYRTPIEQLYICGAATHPGGGVSGLAGVNAAHELGLKSMVVSV